MSLLLLPSVFVRGSFSALPKLTMRLYEIFTKTENILLFVYKFALYPQNPLLFDFLNNTNIKKDTLGFHDLHLDWPFHLDPRGLYRI